MTRETEEPKKKWGIPATKGGVAKLSLFAVSLLIVIKVVASILTGSISIRADAIHSFIDLSGVVIGFIGIRISSRPPMSDMPLVMVRLRILATNPGCGSGVSHLLTR